MIVRECLEKENTRSFDHVHALQIDRKEETGQKKNVICARNFSGIGTELYTRSHFGV